LCRRRASTTGDHFFTYLRDAFDALYAEGDGAPRMMSIGMHCRLLGKPGRIGSLQRFLDHIGRHDGSGSAAASTSPATGSGAPVRRRHRLHLAHGKS
jgi:hypothetical protein